MSKNPKSRPTIKAIVTADIHLDINNRLDDKVAVLRQIARYAVKNTVDMVIILGDVYERKRPYNSEKAVFEKFVKYLSDKHIEVVILAGNHDTDKDGISAVEEFDILKLPNVQLVKNPSVIDFAEYKLLLGHFLINGAKLGPDDYSAGRAVNLKDITRQYKADLYLFGDVHKAQKLQDKPPALYVGSPERNTFGERKEIKGFTLLESPLGELKFKFVPLETRKMVQYDVEDIQEWLGDDIAPSWKDAIVKVKITCTEKQYGTICEESILKKLEGAYSVKVDYNVLKKTRARNTDINEENWQLLRKRNEHQRIKF